jgi:hypothetical protein
MAAAVAVLFLSIATLHVFAHHAADADCGVCHVSQASLPSTAPPVAAVAPVSVARLTEAAAPCATAARPASAVARAPPVLAA